MALTWRRDRKIATRWLALRYLTPRALCHQELRTGRRNGVSMADVTHSCGGDSALALGDFGTGFWLIGQPNDVALNFRVRTAVLQA